MAATYDDLVLKLEQVDGKDETIARLRAGGEDAKPALLHGMGHPSWRVRHGCLRVLDHTIVDDPTRRVVLAALDDPHRKVRQAALHVLGCEVCKPEGYCGIEGVDIEGTYLGIARHDPSRRVRRSAIATLMWRSTLDDRVVAAMREVLATEDDDDLRRRAAWVLVWPEIVDITEPARRSAAVTDKVEALLSQLPSG